MIKTLLKTEKSKKLAKFKNLKLAKTINKILKMNFLTSGAKITFVYLQTVFIVALILYYFYLKRHIQIELINASTCVINKILR